MSKGILDLLRSDGSIVVNKRLIQVVGLVEAVVYSELASRHCYFRDRDKLTPGGYFFNTKEDLEEGTGVTRRQQDAAIKRLMELGLIEVRVMGIPATRHFRFTEANIRKLAGLLIGMKGSESPEDLLLEAFQRAGATQAPTGEVRELVAVAMEQGKGKVKAKNRWG